MMAGTYKFRNDEYLLKHGDPLYAPDWENREREKLRNPQPRPVHVPRPEQYEPVGGMARLPSGRSEASGHHGSGVQQPPARQPASPASPAAVRRVRTGRAKGSGWSWCLRRDAANEAPNHLSVDRAQVEDVFQMARTLSAPSTLTTVGVQERMRVMATPWTGSVTNGTYRPSSSSRRNSMKYFDEPDDGLQFSLPQTTNQRYGARAAEAQPPAKFFPKNTCDVCEFADSATKTLTPYVPHLRF